MKNFAWTLLILLCANQVDAKICGDLFLKDATTYGKFIPLGSASALEQAMAISQFSPEDGQLATLPQRGHIFRPGNANVLILKVRTANSTFDRITVADIKSGLVTHTAWGHDVENVAVSPDGARLFIESEGGITMFGKGTNMAINGVPTFWKSKGMALTADGKALYTFSAAYRDMVIVDTKYLETGIPLSHFADDGTRGNHLWPLSREAALKPSKRVTFEASDDGRFIAVAGDTGAVTVYDTRTEGRNIYPNTVLRSVSDVLRHDFVVRSSPSRPDIKWTSDHSFEITIEGRTDKFNFDSSQK